MRITRAVVPSLFTVLNMFCGFLAIIHASRNEFIPAVWFILLAAGFDAVDGLMARITKSASAFGVQIDSLSDVISFGAAPSFMVYQIHLHTLGGFGVFVSSLLMVFGGLRLARFNVQLVGFEKDHFVGLPIPVSALTIISFIGTYYHPETGLEPGAAAVLPWLVVGLGLLMVSKVSYQTLPKLSRKAIQREPWKYVVAACAAIIALLTRGEAIFPLFLLFIAAGIVWWCVGCFRRLRARPLMDDADDEEDEVIEPTRH